MWRFEQEPAKSVLSALSALAGVCARCRLRCAGVKNSAALREADSWLEKIGNLAGQPPPLKKAKACARPCRLCLGLLEDEFMLGALDLDSPAGESKFDADEFTVALSLPVSLALRSQSIFYFIAAACPDFDEDDVVPIKQAWKWLYAEKIEELTGRKYSAGTNCDFFIELRMAFDEDQSELDTLCKICEDEYAMRAKNQRKYHMGLVTRVGAEKSLKGVSEKLFRAFYAVPPEPPENPLSVKVVQYHNSIFVAGRYNKFSRTLSQTPWILDGKRVMPSSVEELLLEHLKKNLRFDDAKFSSSGREDVDVRMLGRGRPFLFELVNPRQVKILPEFMAKIQDNINNTTEEVFVRNLQVVSKNSIAALKEGEDQKTKTYKALCVIPDGCDLTVGDVKAVLEAKGEVRVRQRTPIRVLHRRPDADRHRTVSGMQVSALAGNDQSQLFLLQLTTQAGTYVKEFVHGDFGRTSPSLKEFFAVDVDILALDVLEIDLDWPQRIPDNYPVF